MAIDKRRNKDGSYSYRVRIFIKGKVVDRATFHGEDASNRANKWERKRQVELDNQDNFPDAIKHSTLEELFDKWLREHAENHKAASSVVRDKQIYRDYIKDYIGQKKVHLVVAEDIEGIKQDLIDEDRLSEKSINNILQVIRTVFNFGIKRRYVRFNPMSSVSMMTIDEQTFDYWSLDETIKFLMAMSEKYREDRIPYVLYLICLKTGMRIGEVVSLKWDCIDFTNRIITVKRTFDTANQNIKETTKGKKIRYIGISDELFPELLALRNQKSTSDFVLPNQCGNFIDYNNFRERVFEKDIQHTGIKRIRLHDLRHTFASQYVMSSGSLQDLQDILGHSEIKTTKRYAHLSPNYKVKIANVLSYGLNKPINVIEFNPTVHSLSKSM